MTADEPDYWDMSQVSVEQAIRELLGDRVTGDREADLWAAGVEAWRRRRRNSLLGGTVFKDLNTTWRYDYRDMRDRLMEWIPAEHGMHHVTLQRWANPPSE